MPSTYPIPAFLYIISPMPFFLLPTILCKTIWELDLGDVPLYQHFLIFFSPRHAITELIWLAELHFEEETSTVTLCPHSVQVTSAKTLLIACTYLSLYETCPMFLIWLSRTMNSTFLSVIFIAFLLILSESSLLVKFLPPILLKSIQQFLHNDS